MDALVARSTAGALWCDFDGDGNLLWPAPAVPVCTLSSNQDDLAITSDLIGGAVIAWVDDRDFGTTNYDIYGQHLDPLGAAWWTAGGITVCDASDWQLNPRVAPDGIGGACFAWDDNRGLYRNVYAQRLAPGGAGTGAERNDPAWAALNH